MALASRLFKIKADDKEEEADSVSSLIFFGLDFQVLGMDPVGFRSDEELELDAEDVKGGDKSRCFVSF